MQNEKKNLKKLLKNSHCSERRELIAAALRQGDHAGIFFQLLGSEPAEHEAGLGPDIVSMVLRSRPVC